MQKLITVSIDTRQLLKDPNTPFTINEVESINELLEDGWEIEEWDFLKEDAGDGQILLLVTLNDDALFDEEDDEFGDGFDYDDDDEDDDMDDEDEEDEKVKRLK